MHLERRIYISPPHINGKEWDLVKEAFDSNYIAPLGPMIDAFEREFAGYTGVPHCLAVNSGTAATHLALRLALPKKTIETGAATELSPIVIASTLTFIGSVTPAVFERCELRFIDCDAESWNMDPGLLAAELEGCRTEGRRVAAVIPTDLYGQCCDLPRINEVCRHFGVPVICDAAEAVGARYQVGEEVGSNAREATAGDIRLRPASDGQARHAGFDAWAAIFSFNGNKVLTTGGGGMLASHDGDMIAQARKLSQQARDDVPWYEHTEIGYNYRMSNVLAAIGRGQLQVLDERVRRRREIFDAYRALLGDLPGLSFMPEPAWSRSNRWLTVILIDPAEFGVDTHAVREALERENIEARPVWKPMHLQPVFRQCRVRGSATGSETGAEAVARGADRLVSEQLFAQGLCLPSGTAMTDEDIERVANGLRSQGSI